ncbi:MAG: Diguanylate cyclase protein [Nocardioides sp.]|nr:Diguanylate cyclase protein [Nocardioides sp.]
MGEDDETRRGIGGLRRAALAGRDVVARLRGLPRRLPSLRPDLADTLTSLGNRAMLTERAARALGPDDRFRALLLIDLDGFKTVNDTLGHLAGDQILVEVGRRIADTVGRGDTAVRLGGDEFAVLTGPLRDPAQADALADRILVALVPPLSIEDVDLTVTASLGIAVQGRDGRGFEQLMRFADQALYSAKSAGGRRAARTEWRDGPAEARLCSDLGEAVDAEALTLHYQPQVSWAGEVVAFEALLRWDHPELGTLLPRQVLPAAERAGLVTRVTLQTIELALRDHARLADLAGPQVTVSVNVSARDLLGHDFLPDISRLLRESGVAPGRLTLEIGEPTPFPVPAVLELFEELDRLGVAVSIHEFGAGQSSLTALSRYAGVREIKVDPSLVRMLAGDEDVARLVRAISGAAHGFGVTVVAEGVEDAPTLERLRDVGVDRLQGFWLGAPGDLDAVAAWSRAWPARRELRLAL